MLSIWVLTQRPFRSESDHRPIGDRSTLNEQFLKIKCFSNMQNLWLTILVPIKCFVCLLVCLFVCLLACSYQGLRRESTNFQSCLQSGIVPWV